ncbi:virginiamycin B lyase family protein [Herbiconiux sp. P16]|uniref:virginiamycin B lyase family protein n=1 Tax=Herbiconiux wuyangfengii TaxID=3342794 RepID=UPI0035B95A4E
MRLRRLTVLPLAAGLVLGGSVVAASAVPEVTNILATLPPGSSPISLAVDGIGNVYTLNSGGNNISKVRPDGTLTAAWATGPAGIAMTEVVSATDGTLYTVNLGAGTISRVQPDGTFTAAYASLGLATQPTGLTIAPDGTLFTANSGTSNISRVGPTGTVDPVFASLAAGSKPLDIVVTPAGDLYTLNQNLTVSRVSAAGMITQTFATLQAGTTPSNFAVASDGRVFVLDLNVKRIEEFSASGAFVRNIALPSPVGRLAIDPQDNLFVTLPAAKAVALIPDGGALIPSIATLTPGADYESLAVTSDDTIYTVSTRSSPIVSRIGLRAKITSPPINTSVQVGKTFTAAITTSGYDPMTYSLSGVVPPGVSVDPNSGVISGPPTTAGTYRFRVVASNLFGSSNSQDATVSVTAAPMPTPTPAPTPSGTATPVPGTGSGGGTGVSASGSLANTGSTVWVPGTLALLLAAAGVAGLVAERRRRRA